MGKNLSKIGRHPVALYTKHPQKKAMVAALKSTLGIVQTATEKVGITRQTHYNWLKEDESYREAVENISEIKLDFVESALFKKIQAGDTTAIIFAAKTLGKKRGYAEKIEVEQRGVNLNIGVSKEEAQEILANLSDAELEVLERVTEQIEQGK